MTKETKVYRCPRCNEPVVKAGIVYWGKEWHQRYKCVKHRLSGKGCDFITTHPVIS